MVEVMMMMPAVVVIMHYSGGMGLGVASHGWKLEDVLI